MCGRLCGHAPVLLPGTHVVRRDADHVQAGLAPAPSVVAPRRPARPRRPDLGDPAVARTLGRAGLLLTDDGPLRRALPPHGATDPWVRHTVSAARPTHLCQPRASAGRPGPLRGHGPRLRPPARSRRSRPTWSGCAAARGCDSPRPPRPGPARHGTRPPAVLDVLVGVGEPPRELLDDRVREASPPRRPPGRGACRRRPVRRAGTHRLPALRRRVPHRGGPGLAAARRAVRPSHVR